MSCTWLKWILMFVHNPFLLQLLFNLLLFPIIYNIQMFVTYYHDLDLLWRNPLQRPAYPLHFLIFFITFRQDGRHQYHICFLQGIEKNFGNKYVLWEFFFHRLQQDFISFGIYVVDLLCSINCHKYIFIQFIHRK